jgi:hypothetical protein
MRQIVLLATGIALLSGCSDKPITTESTANIQPSAAADSKVSGQAENKPSALEEKLGPDVRKDLAELRRVTARFHDFETARDAGWGTQITPCMVDPAGDGGMGFHYGNTKFIDGTAHVDKPQLLLYEPEGNGRLRLVAVEYIIPYTFVPRDAAPPELFGQKFAQVDAFQLWGLHAWVWRENPSGIFKPWNPKVTCDHATAVMSMSH